MGDNESQVKIKIVTTADSSGVDQARSQYDELFAGLKKGVTDALKGEGAGGEFIAHVADEFDRLNAVLNETGASSDEVAQKIAQLEQGLQEAAKVEMKRLEQLKVGMMQALAEKDAEEEALSLARRRKQEDQLAAEQEALASRRRIAALQEERELARSVAQARQMSAEQRIERGVMGQGAYDPREDVERLKQVDAQTSRNIAGMRGYQGSIGDAALAFAYFADDAQYGLRGIMNNIPQLALMLGVGSGLAGVLSVAAIAVNFLWEKFSGASEAAKQTDEATKQTEELTTAITEASEAASRLFQTDFEKYLASLREATELWERQKGHISEALGYQNELAKAEQAAAQAKLEIERQNTLAGAKSDEERKMINAEYDLRKADISQSGQKEAMQRAVDAQALGENSLKARIGDAQAAKDSAQQSATNLTTANQGMIEGIGQQSDQARRRNDSSAAQAEINYLDSLGRDLTARENERRNKAIKERENADLTKEADEAKLKSGKGLTFDGAKADAKAAGDNASVAKYIEAERQLNDNAEAAAKATALALEADKKITELKLELTALEKQGVLLKARQVAQQAEADAADAKRAADKLAADQKADEEHLKKQREEQLRKLENDAKELDKQGLFAAGAKKRNEANTLKLGDDATPEQKRALERENAERLSEGVEKSTAYRTKAEAKEAGSKLSNLGSNLGEAGKDLKEAAEKLKDGATEKELEAVAAELKGLAPVLNKKFAGQEAKFSEILKELQMLKSQIANQRGGVNS